MAEAGCDRDVLKADALVTKAWICAARASAWLGLYGGVWFVAVELVASVDAVGSEDDELGGAEVSTAFPREPGAVWLELAASSPVH